MAAVAMTNGSNFTISGAGSNICTKNSTSAAYAYSTNAYTISSPVLYKINGSLKYTSAISSGTVYVTLNSTAGASSSGNAYTVTFTDGVLTIEIMQDESSDYANKYLGFNTSQTDPGSNSTGQIYIDNATYTAVRESGNEKAGLSGSAMEGDLLQFEIGTASATTVTIPPPVAMVRF